MDRGPTFGCFFGHGRLEGANTLNLKIKFSIEYDDKWIALLLGFEINSMIHFMKWTIHLYWQDVFIPMWIFSFVLFSKINALQCIIYLRCIYHIYFAEEKKWTSLFILLFCGLHTFNQVAFRHIQWSQWNWELFTKNWIRWFSWRGDCAFFVSVIFSWIRQSKDFVKWTHLFVFLCSV